MTATPQPAPVIVVGCPRSGTTMLQLMLHAHPRLAVPPETRFVAEGYWKRRNFGDLRQTGPRETYIDWVVHRKASKFSDLGLDGDAVAEQMRQAPPTMGSMLEAVFRAYAERFDKPRWGDKRPSYFRDVDALLRLFPRAQFIHLVRDGRDCVASLKNMSWYKPDLVNAVTTWAEAIDRGRRNARRLGPQRFMELRYEDLTRDPEAELRKVCAFLGEDFAEEMCEPHRVAAVAVPARKKHHSNTRREVTTELSGQWSQRLEPAEVGLCERVLGSRLRAWGYELSGSGEAVAADVRHYRKVTTRRHLTLRRKRLEDTVNRWWREPTPDLATRL